MWRVVAALSSLMIIMNCFDYSEVFVPSSLIFMKCIDYSEVFVPLRLKIVLLKL